ncbi:unnamed protein product [Periconia digitata]|nr:unnamed protein product [Periconia digitata]
MTMFAYPVASTHSEEILPECVGRRETARPNPFQNSPQLGDPIMAQYDELSPFYPAEDTVHTSPS